MTQDKIKDKINKLYVEYCEFANITEPVPMNIQFSNDIDPYIELGNPSIFSINPRYFKFTDDKILPIIYHEFTHLNDYNTYLKNEDIKVRKSILLLYTEIHATIVELQTAAEFVNTNNNMRLSADSSINSINGRIALKVYIHKSDDILGKYIDSFIKDKTKGKFIQFIKELGYAIGRKKFVDKYVENQMSYPNLSKAIRTFGSDIETIINIGTQDNLSEDDIIHMTELWFGIMQKYTE